MTRQPKETRQSGEREWARVYPNWSEVCAWPAREIAKRLHESLEQARHGRTCEAGCIEWLSGLFEGFASCTASPRKETRRRQRWQAKKIAAGLCRRCGAKPLASTNYCVECLKKHGQEQNRRNRGTR